MGNEQGIRDELEDFFSREGDEKPWAVVGRLLASPVIRRIQAEAIRQSAMEYEIWLGQPSEGSRLLKRIADRIEQNSEGNET